MSKIENNEFYKGIGISRGFKTSDEKFDYIVNIYADTSEVIKYEKGTSNVVEKFEDNPYFLYKFAKESLNAIDNVLPNINNYFNISDDFNWYKVIVNLSLENDVIKLVREYEERNKPNGEDEYIVDKNHEITLYDYNFIKNFMNAIILCIENTDLD